MIKMIKQLISDYKILVYALFLILSIATGIWLGYSKHEENIRVRLQLENKEEKLIHDVNHFKLISLKQDVYLITNLDKVNFSNDYILAQDIEYKLGEGSYQEIQNKVKVFKKEAPHTVYKEYNLLNISQFFSKNPSPQKIHEGLYFKQTDQQLYFAFDFIELDSERVDNEHRTLYVSLDTGQVSSDSTLFKNAAKVLAKRYHDAHEKLADYGLVLAISSNGYVSLEADFDKKPKIQHLKISQSYPQLEKELKAGKSFVITGDQAYEEMVKLLAKDSEEDLYTGLTLSEEYTKDGKEHQLKSYQDFLEWYKQ